MPAPGRDGAVADFGLARALTEARSFTGESGLVMGTPAYMAPKQAERVADADGRADNAHALGCVLRQTVPGVASVPWVQPRGGAGPAHFGPRPAAPHAPEYLAETGRWSPRLSPKQPRTGFRARGGSRQPSSWLAGAIGCGAAA